MEKAAAAELRQGALAPLTAICLGECGPAAPWRRGTSGHGGHRLWGLLGPLLAYGKRPRAGGAGWDGAATHRIVPAEPPPFTPLPSGARYCAATGRSGCRARPCGAAQSAARSSGTLRLALGSGSAAVTSHSPGKKKKSSGAMCGSSLGCELVRGAVRAAVPGLGEGLPGAWPRCEPARCFS